MVGRNDLCPCGSRKKYKKCCMNKDMNKNLPPMELWKRHALSIGLQYPFNNKLVNTLFAVFDYSLKNSWRGACHCVSSISYILLKEQEIDCELYLGFVKGPSINHSFCHSWITIDGDIFDIGLYRSNPSDNTRLLNNGLYVEVSPPIFKGINLETNSPTLLSFGVPSEQGTIMRDYQQLSQMTMGDYMNGWSLHKDGLWGEAVEIATKLKLHLKVIDLKEKYANQPYKS